MAIAQTGLVTPPLTYEEYLLEGEIRRQYDIVDGRRVFMPGPTRGHQRISKNLTRSFLQFEEAFGQIQMYYAPVDIMIRHFPLRTRQPDLLLISSQRLAQAGVTDETVFFEIAPELVVVILSASDRSKVIAAKLVDYAAIGVNECWIVRPEEETVEILTLADQQLVSTAIYRQGENVQSVAFPDLSMAVADVFTG